MKIQIRNSQKRDFYKTIAGIAIPISLQGLITVGVNMMDIVMLGQLGETAISASSLANQFISIFQILCTGLGMGSSVMLARFWGAKDTYSMKKVVTIMYRLAIVLALFFTIPAVCFPEEIMQLYTEDEAVIQSGIRYLYWSLPTFLLVAFSMTTTAAMRSFGQVRVSLLSSIVGFFANIVLNWIFIFGKLGAPAMGIAGAALGTTLARIAETGIICGFFFIKDDRLCFRTRDLMIPCGKYVPEFLKICFPVLVSDAMLALGNSAVAMIMGHIGTAFVSANAITHVAVQLSTIFIQGISNAAGIITGNTIGAGNEAEATKNGMFFFRLGAFAGMIGSIIIIVVGNASLCLYQIELETKEIAVQLIYAVALMSIFQASNSILTKGVLRAGGDTRFLMVTDTAFLWLAAVPLGYLAGLVWRFPPFMIIMCLRADQIIKMLVCVFRLKSGKWIKQVKSAHRTA